MMQARWDQCLRLVRARQYGSRAWRSSVSGPARCHPRGPRGRRRARSCRQTRGRGQRQLHDVRIFAQGLQGPTGLRRPHAPGSVEPFQETQDREGAAAAPVSNDGKRVETAVLLPQPAVLTPCGNDAVSTAIDGEPAYVLKVYVTFAAGDAVASDTAVPVQAPNLSEPDAG